MTNRPNRSNRQKFVAHFYYIDIFLSLANKMQQSNGKLQLSDRNKNSPFDKWIESIELLCAIFQWTLFDSIGQPSPSSLSYPLLYQSLHAQLFSKVCHYSFLEATGHQICRMFLELLLISNCSSRGKLSSITTIHLNLVMVVVVVTQSTIVVSASRVSPSHYVPGCPRQFLPSCSRGT